MKVKDRRSGLRKREIVHVSKLPSRSKRHACQCSQCGIVEREIKPLAILHLIEYVMKINFMFLFIFLNVATKKFLII